MFLLFIICYFILLLVLLFKMKKEFIISPLFWLLSAWIIIIGLYYTAGIDYKYKLTFIPFIYIYSSLFIFIIFYNIGYRINIESSTSYIKSVNQNELKIGTIKYFILAFIGLILWIYDILRLNNINFFQRVENFNISGIGAISMIFINLSLFVWLYELLHSIIKNKLISLQGIFCALIYIIPAIMTAGRQNLLIFASSTIICFLYAIKQNKKYKYKKLIFAMFSLIICIFIFYLIVIINNRSGVSDKNALFEYMFQSKTSELTKSIISKSGPVGSFLQEILYYYSHELPMFDLFYKNYNGPILYGMYQLHYVSRRLPDFLELNYDIPWGYIDIFSKNYGLYSHVWRTALSSFITDFGRAGTIIFITIVGFITGLKRKKFLRCKNKSCYFILLQVLICVAMIFSIQYSPFNEPGWAYTFFWMLIIPLIEKIKLPKLHLTFNRKYVHDKSKIRSSGEY